MASQSDKMLYLMFSLDNDILGGKWVYRDGDKITHEEAIQSHRHLETIFANQPKDLIILTESGIDRRKIFYKGGSANFERGDAHTLDELFKSAFDYIDSIENTAIPIVTDLEPYSPQIAHRTLDGWKVQGITREEYQKFCNVTPLRISLLNECLDEDFITLMNGDAEVFKREACRDKCHPYHDNTPAIQEFCSHIECLDILKNVQDDEVLMLIAYKTGFKEYSTYLCKTTPSPDSEIQLIGPVTEEAVKVIKQHRDLTYFVACQDVDEYDVFSFSLINGEHQPEHIIRRGENVEEIIKDMKFEAVWSLLSESEEINGNLNRVFYVDHALMNTLKSHDFIRSPEKEEQEVACCGA